MNLLMIETISDWFVISKMLEKFHNAHDDIVFLKSHLLLMKWVFLM